MTFFFENRAIYEIMWKTVVQPDRSQTTIQLVRFACWITTATDKHFENVKHCFSMATIVSELASILDYTYIACFVDTKFMHSLPMQPIQMCGQSHRTDFNTPSLYAVRVVHKLPCTRRC